jgi:hypothetical protein
MPRLLKHLVIDEVSMVPHGAGDGTVVRIMKQAPDADGEQARLELRALLDAEDRRKRMAGGELMLYVAKRLAAGEASNAYTKGDFFAELQKRAVADRRTGETVEQAFARYSMTDPTGQLLLKANLRAPDPDEDEPEDMALADRDRIEAKAAELMRGNPKLSRGQALEAAAAAHRRTTKSDDDSLSYLRKSADEDDRSFLIRASAFYRQSKAA